jgi:hypothetical protein
MTSSTECLVRDARLTDVLAIAASLCELRTLLNCLSPMPPRSVTLQTNLRNLTLLSDKIYGECVPHTYAPALKIRMGQIQDMHARWPELDIAAAWGRKMTKPFYNMLWKSYELVGRKTNE